MPSDTDCGSMKVLLKQVYNVYTTKIKNLEDEIEELKKSLSEAENKLKNRDECKRCGELEEAFNSCKAALYEQSKFFENLGQKFLTSNIEEKKIHGEEDAKTSIEGEIGSDEQPSTQVASVKKIDLSSKPKFHFLKNLMSLNCDDNQDSLELMTAPLQKHAAQDYSTLNSDCFILVPNTLDLMNELQEKSDITYSDAKAETINSVTSSSKDKCVTVQDENQIADTNKDLKKSKLKIKDKKRRSDESNIDDENDDNKINKENETISYPQSKKLKSSSKLIDKDIYVNEKILKSNNIISDGKISEKEMGQFSSSKKNIRILNVKIDKISPDRSNNIQDKKSLNEVNKNMENSFQTTVSPSLLPLNEKTNGKVDQKLDPITMAEDINDFQVLPTAKNTSNAESQWTSCDKKKILKRCPKPIKSTSKFRMQLDALPPNYKKPSLRQTKLSKSIFQQKSKGTTPNTEASGDSSDFEINMPSTSTDVHVVNNRSKTVDFDATCIPDNYQCEVVSSNNSVSEGKTKLDDLMTSLITVKDLTDESEEESSAEMIIEKPTLKPVKENGKVKTSNYRYNSPNDLKSSFDRLPKKAEPNYKYKEETVRKKGERKQLSAFDCKECEKYYSELDLTDEEKQKRMHKCSRHRAKFAPPPTPEHFWELEFPDTQECKARGYLDETQKVKLKSHRKKPL